LSPEEDEMDDQRFRIVFEKLREAVQEEPVDRWQETGLAASEEEMEGIAELRRVIVDLCENDVTYHTTT